MLDFRAALQQRQLAYVLGVSGQLAGWIGRPPVGLAPSTRAVPAATIGATPVATRTAQQPARPRRRVPWRNGPRAAWRPRFLAVRGTPGGLRRQHRPLH